MPIIENIKIQNSLLFTENIGQINDDNVLFITKAKDINIFIKKNGIVYQFRKLENAEEIEQFNIEYKNATPEEQLILDNSRPTPIFTFKLIEMNLVNSNCDILILPEDLDDYYETQFINDTYKKVRNFKKIIFKNIYNDIDWIIYSKDSWIKYDFIIHPFADPFQINMQYNGHNDIILDNDKKILVRGELGEISDDILYITQDNLNIDASYNFTQTNVNYNIGYFDNSKELIIDPAIDWATYYGGADQGPYYEKSGGIVTDNSANIYILGITGSTDIISGGTGIYQGTIGAQYQLFLAKFRPDGQRVWGTYYGGNNLIEFNYASIINNLAIDNSNNIIFGGTTEKSSASPTSVVDPSQTTVWRASPPWGNQLGQFIAKMNPNGQPLMSTWITGGGVGTSGNISSISVDLSSNIYVTGQIRQSSFDISTSPNVFTPFQSTRNITAAESGYLIKFTPQMQKIWYTYFSGAASSPNSNNIYHSVLDSTGNIYICGRTFSSSPNLSGWITNGTTNTSGNERPFAAKLSPNGSRLWGTFTESTGDARKIALNTLNDRVYIVVQSQYIRYFPASGPTSAQATSSTNRLPLLSFTSLNDFKIRDNSIYSVGQTNTAGQATIIDTTFEGGASDGFIEKTNLSGSRIWSSYLGGNGDDDIPRFITFDISDNIYVFGTTTSRSGIVAGGTSAFDISNSNYTWADLYLYRITNVPNAPTDVSANLITTTTARITWRDVSDETGYIILYSPNSSFSPSFTANALQDASTNTLTDLSGNQTYFVRVGATNSSGTNYSTDISFTTAPNPPSDLSGVNSSITTSAITLSWSASAGATGYDLSRNGTTLTNVTSGTLNNGGTGLTVGTSYKYAIRAKRSGATGDWSSPIDVFTKSNPPTGLSTSSIGENSLTLTWTNATGASSYTIQYDISSGYSSPTTVSNASTPSNITSLSSGIS
jgi:hypothetical protein